MSRLHVCIALALTRYLYHNYRHVYLQSASVDINFSKLQKYIIEEKKRLFSCLKYHLCHANQSVDCFIAKRLEMH